MRLCGYREGANAAREGPCELFSGGMSFEQCNRVREELPIALSIALEVRQMS